MKLSTMFAKLTFGNGNVMRTLGGLAVAAAAMTAMTPAAHAQVSFGFHVGTAPRYYAPVPPPRPVYRPYVSAPGYPAYGYAPGYWEHRRYEDWRAREVWDHRFERNYGPVPAYIR